MKKVFLVVLVLTLANGSWASTLKESIDIALRNNPSVIASRKKADAADAKLGQAFGAFLPTIKADGTYGRSWAQPATMQFTTVTTTGSFTQTMTFGSDDAQNMKSLQASLSQPLLVAPLFPSYSIAKKGANLAKEDLRKTFIETSYNVTQTYFGVLKAGKMLKLAEESKDMAQSHLKQVQAMLSAGVSTRADLLRAEVQMANSEVSLTKARSGLDLAKDAFNNALGNDLEQEVKLEEEGFTGAVAALPEYKSLLNLAFDNRPDWKEFVLTTGINEENLKLAQAAYLPSVVLSATTGNSINEYPSFKSDVNSWNVVGAASWTLFDGLVRENKVSEAASNLAAQKASEEQVRNGIALEVRDAFLSLKSARETIGSTKKAVDSAEEGYKVSSLRFNSGVGTNLEVIDAQVALTQARLNHLQALFDVEIAKARINKVVGKEII
jgi:outer membrane protein TolC